MGLVTDRLALSLRSQTYEGLLALIVTARSDRWIVAQSYSGEFWQFWHLWLMSLKIAFTVSIYLSTSREINFCLYAKEPSKVPKVSKRKQCLYISVTFTSAKSILKGAKSLTNEVGPMFICPLWHCQ
jgi:hypothetical protein